MSHRIFVYVGFFSSLMYTYIYSWDWIRGLIYSDSLFLSSTSTMLEQIYYNWSLIIYADSMFSFIFFLSTVAPTRKENYVVVPFSTNTVLLWYWCSIPFSFSVFSCISAFVHITQYGVRRNMPVVFPTASYFFLSLSLSFFLVCYAIGRSLVDLLACSLACIHPVPSRVYLCRIFSSYYL